MKDKTNNSNITSEIDTSKKQYSSLAAYYRNASGVIKVIRFTFLLLFVIFCVHCIGFFKDNITVENMNYLMKYITLSGSDNTPSETQISIKSEDSSSFHMMSNDLAVVSDKGCTLYSFSGQKLFDYEYTYSDASAVSGAGTLLVYDTLGRKISMYNTISKFYEDELEYDIKAVDLNDLNYFSVISSEKTYRSGVIVFGPVGKNGQILEMFRWMSPDKYIMSTSLNTNASNLACAAMYNKDGSYVSELRVYNTSHSKNEPLYSYTIDDCLVTKIGYAKNDTVIYALSDGNFTCFNNELSFIGKASYNRYNARFFREFDNYFVIVESNNLSGSSMTAKVYNYSAELVAECQTQSSIIDVAAYDDKLLLLCNEELVVYECLLDDTDKIVARMPLDIHFKAICTDKYARYILIGAKSASRGSIKTLINDFAI